MLGSNDLKQIRQVMREEVQDTEKRLDGRMGKLEKRLDGIEHKFDINSERLEGNMFDMERRLVAKIEDMRKRIIVEVGEFIADHILPQIDDKADQKDVDSIKIHLGM